jgi:glutamyl-Q tRNA(Asp) synthetase
LAAALASWLDARCHGGRWLVRIEDIDPPRERPGAAQTQLRQLQRYGLEPDHPAVRQSERGAAYTAALDALRSRGLVYVCHCTRASLARDYPGGIYGGRCRDRALNEPGAWRFAVDSQPITFVDRRCGAFTENLATLVGDFVVKRRDGWWAYQLAVVVDDAAQGVTHVVRGQDLLDNTARQIRLQQALDVPTPRYLHVPLVRDASGRKLSKSDQAAPLGGLPPVRELDAAWQALGFEPLGADGLAAFYAAALPLWAARFLGACA